MDATKGPRLAFASMHEFEKVAESLPHLRRNGPPAHRRDLKGLTSQNN